MDPSNMPALVDPDQVFAIARSQPRFKAGLAPDKLRSYLLDIATTQAANAVANSAREHVEALYAEHVEMWGERPESAEDRELWEDALDAAANEKFLPFSPQTGAGWQGEYLDDCQLWEPERRTALAHSFGTAFVEGVLGTTDRDQGTKARKRDVEGRLKLLGIDAETIGEFEAGLGKPVAMEATVKTLAQATEIVHAVVQTYAKAQGDALDMEAFAAMVEQACDNDDILAHSAISVLDARAEPVATMAAFRTLKRGSGTFMDDVMMMLFTEEPALPAEPTPAQLAKADKKARAPKEGREKATTMEATRRVPPSVLVALANVGGTDREMAELFNVQRPAYNRCKNSESDDLLVHKDRVAEAVEWCERQSALLGDAWRRLKTIGENDA